MKPFSLFDTNHYKKDWFYSRLISHEEALDITNCIKYTQTPPGIVVTIFCLSTLRPSFTQMQLHICVSRKFDQWRNQMEYNRRVMTILFIYLTLSSMIILSKSCNILLQPHQESGKSQVCGYSLHRGEKCDCSNKVLH